MSWLMHEGELLSFKVKVARGKRTFYHYFYQVKGVLAELHVPPFFSVVVTSLGAAGRRMDSHILELCASWVTN